MHNEWDLLEYMRNNKKWFTTKELILAMDGKINTTEQVKVSRKLKQLSKYRLIEERVCKRAIAWRHENEYKSK